MGTRSLNKKQPTTLDDVQAPKIPNLEPSDTEEEKELLQTVTHCKTTVIQYPFYFSSDQCSTVLYRGNEHNYMKQRHQYI